MISLRNNPIIENLMYSVLVFLCSACQNKVSGAVRSEGNRHREGDSNSQAPLEVFGGSEPQLNIRVWSKMGTKVALHIRMNLVPLPDLWETMLHSSLSYFLKKEILFRFLKKPPLTKGENKSEHFPITISIKLGRAGMTQIFLHVCMHNMLDR